MCSKWWQILVFLMHKEEDLFKTAAPILPHNYQCPKTTLYGNGSRRARRAAVSGKAEKKFKLWRVSSTVVNFVVCRWMEKCDMGIKHHGFCYKWGIPQLLLLTPISVVKNFSSCYAVSDYFILWSYGSLDLAWIRFLFALKLIVICSWMQDLVFFLKFVP